MKKILVLGIALLSIVILESCSPQTYTYYGKVEVYDQDLKLVTTHSLSQTHAVDVSPMGIVVKGHCIQYMTTEGLVEFQYPTNYMLKSFISTKPAIKVNKAIDTIIQDEITQNETNDIFGTCFQAISDYDRKYCNLVKNNDPNNLRPIILATCAKLDYATINEDKWRTQFNLAWDAFWGE